MVSNLNRPRWRLRLRRRRSERSERQTNRIDYLRNENPLGKKKSPRQFRSAATFFEVISAVGRAARPTAAGEFFVVNIVQKLRTKKRVSLLPKGFGEFNGKALSHGFVFKFLFVFCQNITKMNVNYGLNYPSNTCESKTYQIKLY